jgi:type IX secretion system PorP/SprF family membrane protein
MKIQISYFPIGMPGKINKFSLCLLAFLIIFGLQANAQVMHFTQFYAAKNYLNPAFTGIHGCTRIASNYRDQWPSIPGKFVSYTFALDHNFQTFNSSLGLLLVGDRAGSGNLRSTGINMQYAYELNIGEDVKIRAGLQGGITTQGIDYTKLVFGDQIARGGATTSLTDNYSINRVAFTDFATGAIVYSRKIWGGFSVHHLTTPNQSMLRETSPLPRKYSVHGGGRIALDDLEAKKKVSRQVLYPSFNYRSQAEFDQLDLGLYYEHTGIVMGAWYRGLPGIKAYKAGYSNNDAVALIIGYSMDIFNIGYSYDMTISKLGFGSGGAHEISCNYTFCSSPQGKKKKRRLMLPCPSF